MKQSLDNTFDSIAQMTNSIPSPAASQMSNMSNHGKVIKIFSGRDRGRKGKAIKISSGQPGSGCSWSLFEDQALVVLVHDMGPNWELVSDAINSTLQFRCIFRKPKECKERHKILMDRSAGDGADSSEDSGSSQSYPPTLPGIPKGSARQLFQRLQGPMEEDTLKSHFEKIIKTGQKHRYLRNQNDNQDSKQLVPPHNSHVIALSQVFPNNLNGVVLTPDALAIGYQGSHAGSLALSNQGSVPSILPASGVNSSLPGSSGMVLGNNLSSPSGPIAASVRDRYGVARSSPLSVDEQQRIQHYNQLLAGRNIQQSSLSVQGTISGNDPGIRMLPGGNGMALMSGINRSMARSRPGSEGMASPSTLNSGSMLSSSMAGMPNRMNGHSGVGAGEGSSMLRPRESLHLISIPMATFVLFIDTPTWEVHYDPELRSYHFEGRCAVRVFMFVRRPFAHPVPSYRFTPTSPYGDDMIFECAQTRNEQILRTHTTTSAVRDFPDYMPRSQHSETDPLEDPPTHMYSESSAPSLPLMREASEETVTQPRPAYRPRRGAHASMLRTPTPTEIRQWIGYLPPFPGSQQ